MTHASRYITDTSRASYLLFSYRTIRVLCLSYDVVTIVPMSIKEQAQCLWKARTLSPCRFPQESQVCRLYSSSNRPRVPGPCHPYHPQRLARRPNLGLWQSSTFLESLRTIRNTHKPTLSWLLGHPVCFQQNYHILPSTYCLSNDLREVVTL